MVTHIEHLTKEQIAHYNTLVSEPGDNVDLGAVFAEMASRYQKECVNP